MSLHCHDDASWLLWTVGNKLCDSCSSQIELARTVTFEQASIPLYETSGSRRNYVLKKFPSQDKFPSIRPREPPCHEKDVVHTHSCKRGRTKVSQFYERHAWGSCFVISIKLRDLIRSKFSNQRHDFLIKNVLNVVTNLIIRFIIFLQ